MFESAAVSAFVASPLGALVVGAAALLFVRFSPAWAVTLARLFFARMPAAPPAPPAAAPLVELDQVEADDQVEDVGELVAAVQEAACLRWPDMHPADALDRYVVDLRAGNHWHRHDQRDKERREKERAATEAAAAAAAAPATYTPVEFGSVFGPTVELYG